MPCDLDEKFEVKVTNLGVCYTFNGKTPAMKVVEPGGPLTTNHKKKMNDIK